MNWPLTVIAVGFFLLGVAINVWNALGGSLVDVAIPAAMGVLAECVLFFLPAWTLSLPIARRVLAWTLIVFVSAFALTNSLRMASIVAADTTAARADRQTDGTRAADAALDAARKARDEACGRGLSKTASCHARVDEVAKLETAQAQATARVVSNAHPEATDFARLITWLSAGRVQPTPADFDMLWLVFRTLLPQIGGVVLMLAVRSKGATVEPITIKTLQECNAEKPPSNGHKSTLTPADTAPKLSTRQIAAKRAWETRRRNASLHKVTPIKPKSVRG